MWFHLLSVAALIAVGSCLGSSHELISKRNVDPSCFDEFCPCECPSVFCTPCIIPFPPECLISCGADFCPCPKPDPKPTEKEMARGISTINVYPTGPICSGINIAPNLVMTVSNCILGKPIHKLYVTVNTKPTAEVLKVLSVMFDSDPAKEPSPCVLITEKPKKDVFIYQISENPIPNPKLIEYHKWEVLRKGRVYKPTRTKATSYSNCTMDEKPRVCVETVDMIKMGWNDIGTPFVEVVDDSSILRGVYYGANLYKNDRTIAYLPLDTHLNFMRTVLKHSSH